MYKIADSKTIKLIAIFTFIFFFSSCYKLKAAVISPDKYYINVDSSQILEQKLVIYSTPNQTESINYQIKPIGVKKIGENNERSFYEVDKTDTQDASNWINIKNPIVTVNPGETVEVFWELAVPANYTCETKLTGLAISEIKDDTDTLNGTQVSINNEVISQIHVSTTNINTNNCMYYENLDLLEFSTTQPIPIYNYDNIEFKTTIENKADYLAKNIKGFIEIFGLGNKEVVEFNDSNLDIYPHSIRSFSNTWIDPEYPRGDFIAETIYEITHFKFGFYDVRLGITKNVQTPIISTIKIFIFPVRTVIITIGLMLVIFVIVRSNRKTRKELLELKKKVASSNSVNTKKIVKK